MTNFYRFLIYKMIENFYGRMSHFICHVIKRASARVPDTWGHIIFALKMTLAIHYV